MSQGYTLRLRDINLEADDSLLGVRLGRLCIERHIPVISISAEFGVSRATIYNWFCGKTEPCKLLQKRVEEYIDRTQLITA